MKAKEVKVLSGKDEWKSSDRNVGSSGCFWLTLSGFHFVVKSSRNYAFLFVFYSP